MPTLSANVDGGTDYLAQMLDRFDGDIIKTLAAYNAGPEAVERYHGVPPYPETQAYVSAVMNRLADSTECIHETRECHETVRRCLLAAMTASSAHAQVVNQDPAGSSPLVAAMEWIQGTLLGNVATAAAVIAVAVVGFMMLTGRIEWRRGLTVVIGCFIIFGAVAIVSGIRSLAGGLH